MYSSKASWRDVDDYFVGTLVAEDEALQGARSSGAKTSMPQAEVAANQGKLLYLIAKMTGARRVLEFGTLAGYSTIWLARAVGPSGHVTTLEADAGNGAIAQINLEAAGVAGWVDLVIGAASEATTTLIREQVEPFDLFFIDADKPSNPEYLRASLELARPGSIIIGDNVVRDGEVADPASADDRVTGVRTFLEAIADHPRLEGTAIQTVGTKGWDGFAIAVVLDPQ